MPLTYCFSLPGHSMFRTECQASNKSQELLETHFCLFLWATQSQDLLFMATEDAP